MMNRPTYFCVSTFILLATLPTIGTAQEIRYREAPLSTESVLHVSIVGGQGTFVLKRTTGNEVYTVREKSDDDSPARIDTRYEIKGDAGFLSLDLNSSNDGDDLDALSTLFSGGKTHAYFITLTDKIPVYLDITIGAGDGRLDFTGLRLRSITMECGAASMRIRVGEPNVELLRECRIAAGIGKVISDRLGNLNFEHLYFEGGVGEYRLDFSGKLRDRARINADLGVGSLDVYFPTDVGVLARKEDNWLNTTRFARFTETGNGEYSSENYKAAERRVLFEVQSGIGSVSVNWK